MSSEEYKIPKYTETVSVGSSFATSQPQNNYNSYATSKEEVINHGSYQKNESVQSKAYHFSDNYANIGNEKFNKYSESNFTLGEIPGSVGTLQSYEFKYGRSDGANDK